MSQTATARARRNPLYRKIVLGALWLAMLYAFIRIFPYIRDLVVVVIIAVVLTYIFRPVVSTLERRGLGRTAAIGLIFALVLLIIVLALNSFVPAFIDEVVALSSNTQQFNLQATIRDGLQWADQHAHGIMGILKLDTSKAPEVQDKIISAVQGFGNQSLGLLKGAVNVLSLAIVVPFLLFFLLKDGDKMVRVLIRRVPNRFFEMAVSLSNRIDRQLGNYLRSVILESSIVGLLIWGGFEVMGLRFALILGIINGLLNMIPFFGPLIAYVPTAAVVVLTYHPLGWGLLWMVVIIQVAQGLDNLLLKPLLISRSTQVHPAMVLIVVLIGGRVAGAIGMFIAVPAYAIVQVIVIDLYDHLKKYRLI